MSLEDITALYVVRENLEGLAARLAATRSSSHIVDRLQAIHAHMCATATDEDSTTKLAQQNLEFHRVLRQAAGNPYLERVPYAGGARGPTPTGKHLRPARAHRP